MKMFRGLLKFISTFTLALTFVYGVELKTVDAESYKDILKSNDAEILVVNFWATWCPPCRIEFPDFVKFSREAAASKAAVLFVSADFENEQDKAVAFLRQQGVKGVSYHKVGKDGPFLEAVSENWRGALPATIIYGPERKQLFFHEGVMSYEQLVAEVKKIRRLLDADGGNRAGSAQKE